MHSRLVIYLNWVECMSSGIVTTSGVLGPLRTTNGPRPLTLRGWLYIWLSFSSSISIAIVENIFENNITNDLLTEVLFFFIVARIMLKLRDWLKCWLLVINIWMQMQILNQTSLKKTKVPIGVYNNTHFFPEYEDFPSTHFKNIDRPILRLVMKILQC